MISVTTAIPLSTNGEEPAEYLDFDSGNCSDRDSWEAVSAARLRKPKTRLNRDSWVGKPCPLQDLGKPKTRLIRRQGPASSPCGECTELRPAVRLREPRHCHESAWFVSGGRFASVPPASTTFRFSTGQEVAEIRMLVECRFWLSSSSAAKHQNMPRV